MTSGTLDAACAFGPGKPVLLTFDGDHLTVEPVNRVGRDVHLVVADLAAAKDTVAILRDLQTAYPRPASAIHEGVHKLLGEMNEAFVSAAVRAIAEGDVEGLGGVYVEAQAAFDVYAGAACPTELTAPKLHQVLRHPALTPHVHGGGEGGKTRPHTLDNHFFKIHILFPSPLTSPLKCGDAVA